MIKCNNQFINEITNNISNFISKTVNDIPYEFEKNIKYIIKSAFEKLELVTIEEFNIQKEIILKNREKIEILEQKLNLYINKNISD